MRIAAIVTDGDAARLGVAAMGADAARALVRRGSVRIVVVGPEGDAPALIAALVADARHRPLGVLALACPSGVGAAFTAGATDCAGWPVDAAEVAARLTAIEARMDRAAAARAAAAEARRLAHTDPVTGLSNRHHLDAALSRALGRAEARGRPLSVLMIDIDGFKPINDRHGHAAGDRVLKAIGARLAANVRAVDTLARYGGDELVVVMPGATRAAALTVAERLCRRVAAEPCLADRPTTISVGVAERMPGDDATTLMGRADAALYAAKIGGRNRAAA